MQVEAIIARLKASAPSLRTVEGAGDFAALMAANALPQAGGIAAFVMPRGLRGGEVTSASELFVQFIDESINVLLIMRNADRTHAKAAIKIEPAIQETITAIAGWAPEKTVGVFRLISGSTAAVAAGSFAYLIEFAIADQLRIYP